MNFDEVADLVLLVFEHSDNDGILVQELIICTIEPLLKFIMELFSGKREEIKVINVCYIKKMYIKI